MFNFPAVSSSFARTVSRSPSCSIDFNFIFLCSAKITKGLIFKPLNSIQKEESQRYLLIRFSISRRFLFSSCTELIISSYKKQDEFNFTPNQSTRRHRDDKKTTENTVTRIRWKQMSEVDVKYKS